MKSILLTLATLFLAATAHAQWQSTTYALEVGWNSIYLHGDATHETPDQLFKDYDEVTEVWRWNPNPNQTGFTTTPLLPNDGTPEWSKWVRGGPAASLIGLTGQSAYLVKCSAPVSVAIAHRPLPPSNTWVRSGANFLGFPSSKSGGSYPTISSYFATFPAAVAAKTEIFKYVGGALGPANPMQVFSTSAERLDRNQAYWFSSEVVGNFYAPVQISLSSVGGFNFGRRVSVITARVFNRSSAVMSLLVSPVASNSPPSGQEAITGPVPMTRRIFNGQGVWEESPLAAAFTVEIAPNSSIELHFGIDRASMTGTPEALFASLLRFTDSAQSFDILYPATARQPSLAGLWVGEASVTAVESKAQQDVKTPTGSSFPLRYLLHISDDGTARILSQVFLGPLASAPHPVGLSTKEDGLNPSTLASAMRIVSTHMPLDLVLAGSGSVKAPGDLSCQIVCPHNDPTNPFVHQYHPDHDNKSGATVLESGVESYTVTRNVTFTFTESPPGGGDSTGWGSSVIGGDYAETVNGLHRDSEGVGNGNGLELTGTFQLQRASEIGSLEIVNGP